MSSSKYYFINETANFKLNKVNNLIVDMNTKLSDLKPGDLVITAEIHRVIKVEDEEHITCVDVKPLCQACNPDPCGHEYIKELGWGQQSIAKIINKELK